MLKDFRNFCEYNNFKVDCTSSKSIQESLNAIDNGSDSVSKVISFFLLKAMKNALYFCTGMSNSVSDFKHYALNVPLYTHFTSPIRRYPDVIVHRLLAAALGYRAVLRDSCEDLHRLAARCNNRKMASRIVSDASAKLFLSMYIREIAPVEEVVVIQVLDHSIDVLVLKYGQQCRVYLDQAVDIKNLTYTMDDGVPSIHIIWNKQDVGDRPVDELGQDIRPCTVLKVQINVSEDDVMKWNVSIRNNH